jgi:hypothetical protein
MWGVATGDIRGAVDDENRTDERSRAGCAVALEDLMNATATVTPVTGGHAPQHMQALARANEVRLARADLKRRVSIGDVAAAEVILTSPWEAETMTVSDLLLSQRRWGHQRCRKLLAQVPMSESKTIGTMTQRQRVALAALLSAPPRRSEVPALYPVLA